jgi:uncharacterized protein YeaO (DUF488 family)
MEILLKRAYVDPSNADGFRVLVDRLWPRGKKKADFRLNAWVKEIAPSTELRKWFDHDSKRWLEFCKRDPTGEKGDCRHRARCAEVFRDHFDLRSEGYRTQ